jgi:hypothetical protein
MRQVVWLDKRLEEIKPPYNAERDGKKAVLALAELQIEMNEKPLDLQCDILQYGRGLRPKHD